jgi:acetyl esterase/lipase
MQTIPLWPDGNIPGAKGSEPGDVPTLTLYPPANPNGAAIVICPGGGYGHLADHEGAPVAEWLNRIGVFGAVLRYRLGPRYQNPAMHHDVSRALRTVRAHAVEWSIEPDRVGVLGFSAGGHLAATVSVHNDDGDPNASDPIERHGSRPDVAVLIYPVIEMEGAAHHAGSRRNLLGENPTPELVRHLSPRLHVGPRTPPTFLVHSTDDTAVPIANSLEYAEALKQAGIYVRLYQLSHGGHGYGMGDNDPELSTWRNACYDFLHNHL